MHQKDEKTGFPKEFVENEDLLSPFKQNHDHNA